jgi:enoyl-CoA hydratase
MSTLEPYLAKFCCRSQFLHSELCNRLGAPAKREIHPPKQSASKMSDTATLEADLLYETRDGIGRITFNRPQARNSLTFGMYERLAEICANAGKDGSLKVLILTGAGDKAFASGTDINQFRAFKTAQDAIDYEARIDHVLGMIEQCPVPTIAAINGVCAGGGA